MRFLSALISISLMVTLSGCVSAEDRFAEAVQKVQASIESDDLDLAKAQLTDALAILPESEEGAELSARIETLIDSKESFEKAEAAAEQSDFKGAVENLNLVSDLDRARETDKDNLLSSVTTAWNEALLTELKQSAGPATPKLQAVDEASDLIKITNEVWVAYEKLVVDVSTNFAQAGDFKAQFEFLAARTPNEFPTSKIAELQAQSQGNYENAVKSQVNKLFDSNKLEQSQNVITAALLVIPSSEVFQNLQAQQKKKEKAEEERQRKAALAAMFVKSDSFEGINWYYDRATYNRYVADDFYLYIGKKKSGEPWLRFKAMYYDDDWIFFDEIRVNVDGEVFTITADYFDVERDNSGGNVWEWLDISPGSYELNMINSIIGSKSTTVRFKGDQYHSDMTLSAATKRGLKNVLLAYQALGGD
jgi:hypothetical protein